MNPNDNHLHLNYLPLPIKSDEKIASKVSLGKYCLSDELTKLSKSKSSLSIPEEALNEIDEKFLKYLKSSNKSMHIRGDEIYVSKNSNETSEPQLGDMRIRFYEIKCGLTTLVAQQDKDSFVAHIIEGAEQEDYLENNLERIRNEGCCKECCLTLCAYANEITRPIKEIQFLFEDDLSKEEIFEEITNEQQRQLWIIR